MDPLYYPIPLDFGKIVKRETIPKCDLYHSVKNFVHLIILTSFLEYRKDKTFGCHIWDKQFEILPFETKWRDEIENSILQSLRNHEPRLENIQVKIQTVGSQKLIKMVSIRIFGEIKHSAELFEHDELIYLCPKGAD